MEDVFLLAIHPPADRAAVGIVDCIGVKASIDHFLVISQMVVTVDAKAGEEVHVRIVQRIA
jgi:hypothetical protein